MALVLAGCGCGDDAEVPGANGSPRTVILDAGSGPGNEEPLFPLRAGYRGYGPFTFAIQDRIVFGGQTVYRVLSQANDELPDVAYWSTDDEGNVYTVLLNRDDAHPRPLLTIPRTVRDGMIWEAWSDKSIPDFILTASGPEERPTPFGTRRVWMIRAYQADGTTGPGAVYAEGIGMIGHYGTELAFFDRLIAPDDDAGGEVIDPGAPIALEPVNDWSGAPLDLGALADEAAGTPYADPLSLSVLRHPGGQDATVMARLNTWGTGCDAPSFLQAGTCPIPLQWWLDWTDGAVGSAEFIRDTDSPSVINPGGVSDLTDQHDALMPPLHAQEVLPISDGSGVAPAGRGEAHYRIPRRNSWKLDGLVQNNAEASDTEQYAQYIAIFGAEDAAAWPVRAEVHGESLPGINDDLPGVMSLRLTRFDHRTGSPDHAFGDVYASRYRYGDPHFDAATRIFGRSRVVDGASTGGDLLLRTAGDLWVGMSDVTFDGRPVTRPWGVRMGTVSVEAHPTEQIGLVTNRDGLLEELRLVDGGAVEHRILGRLDAPTDQAVVGAVRVPAAGGGEELVVATFGAPWTNLVSYGPPGDDLAQTVALYRAPLPSGATAPRPFPAASTLTVDPVGLDVLVCWAPGSGALPLDGWTLAEQTPAAVVRATDDDSCVLLVRELSDHESFDDRDPAFYTVHGEVPGAGPTWLWPNAIDANGVNPFAVQREAGFVDAPCGPGGCPSLAPEPVAPLADGGFVNPFNLFGEGLHVTGAPDRAFLGLGWTYATMDAVPDLGGHGLWHPYVDFNRLTDPDSPVYVTRLGRDTVQFEVDEPSFLLPVPGGGVVAFHSPRGSDTEVQYTQYEPDGTVARQWGLPARAWVAPMAVTAEGTLCGAHGGAVRCTDPDGTEREIADPSGGGLGIEWLPLPSGAIVVTTTVDPNTSDANIPVYYPPMTTWLVDPAGVTVTALDERRLLQLTPGPDGRLWGIVWERERPGFVVEITASGFVEVPFPFARSSEVLDPSGSPTVLSRSVRTAIGRILVGEEVMVLYPRNPDPLVGHIGFTGSYFRMPLGEAR